MGTEPPGARGACQGDVHFDILSHSVGRDQSATYGMTECVKVYVPLTHLPPRSYISVRGLCYRLAHNHVARQHGLARGALGLARRK